MAAGRTYSKRSLHGQIAHEIGLEIVAGVLPAGTALPKEEIACARLGVSRTAYREALKVLSAKNLVHSRPKTGTVVKSRSSWSMLDPDLLAWHFEAGPSFEFARSLYELRMMVEPEGAALAALHATDQQKSSVELAFVEMSSAAQGSRAHVNADVAFHQAILVASGNELLMTLGSLIETGLAKGFQLTNFDADYEAEALEQHGKVKDAILKGDPVSARSEMRTIIASAWKEMKDRIGDRDTSAEMRETAQYILLRAGNEKSDGSSEDPGNKG